MKAFVSVAVKQPLAAVVTKATMPVLNVAGGPGKKSMVPLPPAAIAMHASGVILAPPVGTVVALMIAKNPAAARFAALIL